MPTGSAISGGSSSGWPICNRSALTRFGCRRSFPRRWPISVMTSPITQGSMRCSARWPTSRRWQTPRMPVGSESSSISCPTIPPISIPGSSKAGVRATIQSATGTSGAIRRRTAGRLATGCRNSAAAPGNTTPRRGNIIITPSLPSSRI